MTIFRDFQGPRPRRDIGIARPRRDRDTQKRVSRPRHVSRHPALCRGSSPRFRAWATQLRKNVTAVAALHPTWPVRKSKPRPFTPKSKPRPFTYFTRPFIPIAMSLDTMRADYFVSCFYPFTTRKRSKRCFEHAHELPTTCLSHQDGGIPLSAFPTTQQVNLRFVLHTFPMILSVKQGSCEHEF